MEFFNKLGETIVSAGKDVTQKTKELTDVAKIKFEMSSKEDELKKLYIDLGKVCYEKHKNEEDTEFEQIELIKLKKEELRLLKQDELELRNAKQCPKCGTEVKNTAAYCSVCGNKLSIFEDEDEE